MIVESYEDVIVLSGALRSNFWDTVHTAISLMLKRHPSGVVIDCSGITECTPAGADTFRDMMDFVNRHSARVIVAEVPPPVLEVLKSVPEVRSQLATAPSVEAARRSIDLLLEEEPKRKKTSVHPVETKVLVCLTGNGSDAEALNVSAHLGHLQHAEVNVVVVVLVPRDLPLQAPLAEKEELAAVAIEKAKAFLNERHLPYKAHLERGRDIPTAIASKLEETGASQVIVPLWLDERLADENARLVKGVLAKVKQSVVFVRPKL